VVATVLNAKGNSIYDVKWNHEYMDVPVVEDQNTPSFTASEIETILEKAEGQDGLIYALLAGTGRRVGECFALRIENVCDKVLYVRRQCTKTGLAWVGAR
jgi:integrase